MNISSELRSLLTPTQVKDDAQSLATYGRDWTTYYDIHAGAVVFPESTSDVQKLIQWARQNKVALVPSGGRTGLSGAACALHGEVIVSMDRMNSISEFSALEQTVKVGPGVITEELQRFAREKGLYYPVDFAARGSSQIGGNIATNAGGIKVLRYGLTRDWVLGLEVVTGAGEVLHLNNGLVKNATGYDLRHLMIGSEGTLGIVTQALIKLAAAPPALQVIAIGAPHLEAVMQIYAAFKASTTMVAFEMFSEKALQHVLAKTNLSRPFPSPAAFYILMEIEAPHAEVLEQIGTTFETCLEKAWAVDGSLAQSEAQAKDFWRLREDISESLSSYSPYKNDVSVAVGKVPDFVRDLDGILARAYPDWEVVWFGHIGDGNLHINILRPAGMSKEEFVTKCRKVDELVFACVARHQGSISAEHGVGLSKKSFLHYTRSPEEIQLFQQIKNIFDPDGILNPGKLLP